MAKVTLYVVRHGETDWNAEGRLQGQLDVPLNDRGRMQASAAGKWLAHTVPHVSAIISSDLSRAHETATIIASSYNVNGGPAHTVHKDSRLRETNLGVWQTRKWAEVEAEEPEAVRNWRTNPDGCMCGGETTRARFHRVVSALHDAVQRHGRTAGGQAHTCSLVVVAHGGVIDDVGRMLLCVPFRKGTGLKKLNCSITVASFDWSVASPRFVGGQAVDLDAVTIDPEGAALHVAASPEASPWALVRWGVVDHLKRPSVDDGRPVEEGSLASDTGVKQPGHVQPLAVSFHCGAGAEPTGSAAGLLPGEEATAEAETAAALHVVAHAHSGLQVGQAVGQATDVPQSPAEPQPGQGPVALDDVDSA